MKLKAQQNTWILSKLHDQIGHRISNTHWISHPHQLHNQLGWCLRIQLQSYIQELNTVTKKGILENEC